MKLLNDLIKHKAEDLTEKKVLDCATRNVRFDVSAQVGDYIVVIISWQVNHLVRDVLDGRSI